MFTRPDLFITQPEPTEARDCDGRNWASPPKEQCKKPTKQLHRTNSKTLCFSVYLFICLLVCFLASLLSCLHACLPACLFVCLFNCLSVCFRSIVCLFVCVSLFCRRPPNKRPVQISLPKSAQYLP